MKGYKTLLVILINIFIQSAIAQDDFAIIRDKDGYTNVRKSGINSAIVGKIYNNEVFDCMESEDVGADRIQNMMYINFFNYVAKPDWGYSQNEYGWIETDSEYGYIHKSRVLKIKDLPRFKNTYTDRYKASYEYNNITINFEFRDFDPKKHILKNHENEIVYEEQINDFDRAYGSLFSIDGDIVWGVDGTIPRTEIKSITIKIDNSVINLPPSSLKNIFEPYFEDTVIGIAPDKSIYIWMPNGDGAASYNVIWVIANNKLKYRFVQLGFYV